jgi:hypothetical protein
MLHRSERVIGNRMLLETSRRISRPHSREQLQHTKRRDLVSRILCPFEYRQHVLDVARLEKLQPAILDVGNVPSDQLKLEPVTMVRPAKEDGLIAKLHSLFAIRQDRFNNELRFCFAVFDSNVAGFCTLLFCREQVLPVLPLAFCNKAVCAIENLLRRTVIFLEADDRCRGLVLVRESEDVFYFRSAK